MKTINHKNNKLISNIIIVFLVIALPIFVWALVNLNFNYNKKAASGEPVDIAAGEPQLGDATAPVTIVEYGDLTCPYCKIFADNTLHQILQEYPNEVRFIYKDFPLTDIHPFALEAAIAGQCAFDQDKFWEMHDLILSNQDTLSDSKFSELASVIPLDMNRFNACFQNKETLIEVQDDISEGKFKNVSGTPTFFVNGEEIAGAYPYEYFKNLIDSKLGIVHASPSASPVSQCNNSCQENADCSYGYICYTDSSSQNGSCRKPECVLNSDCTCVSTLPPSPVPSPTSTPKTGDVNRDNKVNMVDIGIVVDEYDSTNPANPLADVNDSGRVDLIDIGIIVDNYEW